MTPLLSALIRSDGPESLQQYRARAEIVVSLAQLSIILLFGALYLSARKPDDGGIVFHPVPVALGIYLAVTTFRLVLAVRGRLTPAMLYGSIIIDFALLYGLIWSFHVQYGEPPAFYLKAPTLLYAFIFIVLRSLRLEEAYVLAAGATAAVGWLLLAGYALAVGGEAAITRQYVEYMTSPKILIGAEIDKVVAIGTVTGVLAFAVREGRLILEREIEARRSLHRTAYVDPLTGLGSRLHLQEMLDAELRRGPVMLMMLDIDGFAALNDSLGHEKGDGLLRSVARRLQMEAPSEGHVARIGADSFAVIFPSEPGVPSAGVDRRPEALFLLLHTPFGPPDATLSVCISGGVAASEPGATALDVIRDAGIALSRARAGARGRLARFDASERVRVAARVALEADLRQALRRGQLSLAYQPIVTLSDGAIAGFEALLRWRHPERGSISPADFIPIAEETGQIVEIGAWVLQEAAEAAHRMRLAAGSDCRPFMSINVSARQFDDSERLKQAVRRASQKLPGALKVEVTESVLIGDAERAAELLKDLAETGASLSLDDFGTGYSSLGQLERLPFRTLKIDRSFVSGLGGCSRCKRVVDAIMTLADGLQLETVAEGVETTDHRDALVAVGCTYGQGWLFGRPMPEEACLELLRRPAA